MKWRLASIALLAGAFTLAAHAGAPVLETALAPPETPYHRAAVYAVTVECAPEAQIEFPDIAVEGNQVEVRKTENTSEPVTENVVRRTQFYRIDAVSPGMYVLPPVTVTWREGEAGGTMTAPPLALNARALTPAETEAAAQFAGITAPGAVLPPEAASGRLWLLGAGMAVAAAAALLAVWRYRRRGAPAAAAVLPAWEVALNRLRELNQRDLPGMGKLDLFYVDLSSILRYYIEDRFLIQAPEQTTPEFIEAAATRGVFSDAQQQFLSEFLRQCDRIKFARFEPGAEEASRHFTQVRVFVKETIPEGTAPEQEGQAA